jgi:hypothetical protein
LRQARAPLITIDDASPLSSPDASGTPTASFTKENQRKERKGGTRRKIGFLIFVPLLGVMRAVLRGSRQHTRRPTTTTTSATSNNPNLNLNIMFNAAPPARPRSRSGNFADASSFLLHAAAATTPAARSYRPQPPLVPTLSPRPPSSSCGSFCVDQRANPALGAQGIDDDGDHQGGPTPHLAFAEPPPLLLAGAQGAAGALVSQASAATTRPHARTSGAYDNPQQQQHHARQEQYRQYQRQYQHEHPLEELRQQQQQQQQEPHQHSQRPHPVLARAESAPALPPMTPPAHSSLAAIERAFPSSSSAAQPDRPPRLPPLCGTLSSL